MLKWSAVPLFFLKNTSRKLEQWAIDSFLEDHHHHHHSALYFGVFVHLMYIILYPYNPFKTRIIIPIIIILIMEPE